MINVLADQYLYHLDQFLPDQVNLNRYDSNKPLDHIPDSTDAWLIRTVNKINPDTYSNFPPNLRFIGTGSAGTDHVDVDYLQQKNIAFSNAAGCNARSVGEYVATALLLWAKERQVDWSALRVGIIGVGHTGRQVQHILQDLGIATTGYDPPREKRDGNFNSASIKEVLDCDVLTFHVPLTQATDYPTFYWLDAEKLHGHPFSLIINASRGGVVNEQGLLEAQQNQRVQDFILDVWENEPLFSDEVARRAFIKTPHIAGYSVQAKERASKMIADALCAHFSINFNSPEISGGEHNKDAPKFWSLTDALTYCHPIDDYKTRFMMLIGRTPQEKKDGFNRIRTKHPLRDEYRYWHLPKTVMQKYSALKKLGIPGQA